MSFSNDIKKRLESVNTSMVKYRELHNSIFNANDSDIALMTLKSGLPYYIKHALTGKLLTMSTNIHNTLTLENKPSANNPLEIKKTQEWNLTDTDSTDTDSTDNRFKISSNIAIDTNTKCLSYDNLASTVTTYQPKILNYQVDKSIWSISNNNSYKTIKVGINPTLVLDFSDNKLEINKLDIQSTLTLQNNIINTQYWIIMPSPLAFLKLRDDIYTEINEIKNLVKTILPNKVNNNAAIGSNVFKINETIVQLENAITELDRKTTEAYTNNPDYDPEILEGNYQHTTLDVNSKFYHYSAYILFAIFIIASLIYIYINPDETSLDIFMLALSILILLYYIYDYFKRKPKVF